MSRGLAEGGGGFTPFRRIIALAVFSTSRHASNTAAFGERANNPANRSEIVGSVFVSSTMASTSSASLVASFTPSPNSASTSPYFTLFKSTSSLPIGRRRNTTIVTVATGHASAFTSSEVKVSPSIRWLLTKPIGSRAHSRSSALLQIASPPHERSPLVIADASHLEQTA